MGAWGTAHASPNLHDVGWVAARGTPPAGTRQRVRDRWQAAPPRLRGHWFGSGAATTPALDGGAGSGFGIDYSSYFGGQGSDVISSIAIRDDGAMYIAGSTESLDFPFHDGPPRRFGFDAFVLYL